MGEVAEMVTRLWKATSEKTRLSFERHPVDEVRSLEACLQELEAKYARDVAEPQTLVLGTGPPRPEVKRRN